MVLKGIKYAHLFYLCLTKSSQRKFALLASKLRICLTKKISFSLASSIKVAPLTFKKDKNGLCPIAIRITVDRKIHYVYTGQRIDEKHWSEKEGGHVKSSHPSYKMINTLIANKRAEVANTLIKAELDKQGGSSAQVKKTIQKKTSVDGFFTLANLHLEELEKAKKVSRLWSERPRIKHFREFVTNSTGESEIQFQDVSETLLKKFIDYLKGNRDVGERTAMNYMVVIRTILNRAIEEGLCDKKHYPFGKGKISIRFPESVKIGLTESEVKQIEELELLANSPIWHARNVWLISFYFAGIRNGDVLRLKWSDLKDNRLYYTMGKNKKVVSVKIPDKAEALQAL